MQTGMNRVKGFTIVELIVTLIIIGALAGMGIPLFFNIQDFRQRGFFDEVVSAVRYAQKHAVATGCVVRVQTTATGFTLFRAGGFAACNTGPYNTIVADPAGGAAGFTRTAPADIALNATDFTFTALGAASANVEVQVGNRRLCVVAGTGYVLDTSPPCPP